MTSQWYAGPVRFDAGVAEAGAAKLAEGVGHLQEGRCLEAVALLTEAVRLRPDRAEVWTQLGTAWAGIDQSAKARDCFERSLALDPAQPLLWSNLGVIRLRAGEPGRALDACRRALRIRPDLASAKQNAALALYMLDRGGEADALVPQAIDRHLLRAHALRETGRLEEATGSCREAILIVERGARPQPQPSSKAFTSEGARTTLLAAKERLDGAGIPFCLFAGTLLGIVRNGDVLPHDKDLDFGVPWEADRQRVVETLCAGGRFSVPMSQASMPQERPFSRSFVHHPSGCALDLFFLKPEGDSFLCGLDTRPEPTLSRLKRFELRDWAWADTTFRVPDPPEQYLAEIYGPGWRVPDPHYDTVLSNPARTEASLPLAICTGYFRLCEALAEGRVARACSIAAQIHLRKPDPFLTGLMDRLRAAAGPAGQPK